MNGSDLSAHIVDPDRLAALRAVALLDTPTEESFDRLTELAAQFINAPVALVSLIDADRQFFKSCLGLPEPWLSRRETPLSHSFCQYNRIASHPLLVEDARSHPLFKNNPAINELNVIAYLGIPLVTSDGYVLGSFCVIDSKPRHWDEKEVNVVNKLAFAVMSEIQLRAEIASRCKIEERLKMQNEELRKAHQDLEKESSERLWALEQVRQREQMLIQQGRLAAMGEMISNIAHQWRQPLNNLGLIVQNMKLASDMGELAREDVESNVSSAMDVILHMSKTIDDFRNFFRDEKEPALFNVNQAVSTALNFISPALKSSGINLELNEQPNVTARGFSNEYIQVILNILNNARDALMELKIADPLIRVRIYSEEGRSVVTIGDNGGGINEDILPKIFDPYFSTKGHGQGTGLGLYMSKVIIEKNMGGSLTASNVNGGAEFRIEL